MLTWRIAIGTTLGALALSACGSSSPPAPTAEQQVCSAKADLSSSLQKVVDDVKALNFGQAKTDLAAVKTDAADLATAVEGLAADKRSEIQPQVDALKTTLSSLGDATSLEQLGTTLATAKTQAEGVFATITEREGCSSQSASSS